MAQLTRDEMEAVIRSGGSVLHNGQLLTRLEHLPSAADLAAGNPEQEAAAAAALDTQIAALQSQRDRLARLGLSPVIQPPSDQPPAASAPAAETKPAKGKTKSDEEA